jgi:hypothetical protein
MPYLVGITTVGRVFDQSYIEAITETDYERKDAFKGVY